MACGLYDNMPYKMCMFILESVSVIEYNIICTDEDKLGDFFKVTEQVFAIYERKGRIKQ